MAVKQFDYFNTFDLRALYTAHTHSAGHFANSLAMWIHLDNIYAECFSRSFSIRLTVIHLNCFILILQNAQLKLFPLIEVGEFWRWFISLDFQVRCRFNEENSRLKEKSALHVRFKWWKIVCSYCVCMKWTEWNV